MADTSDSSTPRRAAAPPPLAAENPDAPPRPPLTSRNAPPVLVKQPPPFSVRLCQLLWVLSFAAGGIAVVYLFVIRQDQLPQIADAFRGVDASRAEETYTKAADIIYWSAFAAMVVVLVVQITLLVSFMNRREGVRWWQLATLIVQGLLFALALEFVANGDKGVLLRQVLIVQTGLVLLALLVSNFPGAIAWTARKHDVRRGIAGSGSPEL